MIFKKNKEKILTARNELEINNIQKLKEFHLSEINNWGVAWNKHSALTLQRNSVSKILHLDNMYKKIAGASWWYGVSKTSKSGAQYKPSNFYAIYVGFRCAFD